MGLPNSTKTHRGLTVMELLVVLAALAILAGILLPLLGRSRQLSYRTQCASNLKQLSNAFTLYAGDWSDFWPAPGGLYGDRTYWSQSGSGGLESYVKQRGIKTVWCCPLLPEWHGRFPPRSYSMNSYLRTPPDKEYPGSLSFLSGINWCKIPSPGHTILLFEGMPLTDAQRETLDYLYRCANWTKVRGFQGNVAFTIDPGTPWHGKINNYLYCDGHVVARRPGRWTLAELSTGSEMYQWYVDKGKFMATYHKCWSTVPWE